MPGLDLNDPGFQRQMVALEKQDRHALLNTLAKLLALDWPEVYSHPGLNWEQIKALHGPAGQPLYSLRVNQKMRLVGWREGDLLRLISIHPDHDGAHGR